MKKTFLKLLTVVIVVCATLFTLTACEKQYTAKETDELIAKLQLYLDSSKNELDTKINALIEEYEAKDSELLAKITENEQNLAGLRAEYAEELKKLQDKDLATEQSIAELDAKYLEEVEIIKTKINGLYLIMHLETVI
ncbi:MAG: hypothetical protein E7347_06020 [Clostridiales bacterium]|nr:hypothetical protein [Clostridiales bacterium]